MKINCALLKLIYFVVIGFEILLSGCVHTPTVGNENSNRVPSVLGQGGVLAQPVIEPIRIKEKTIVIDARSVMEFSLSHIPNSISLQWSRFTETDEGAVLLKQGFVLLCALGKMIADTASERSFYEQGNNKLILVQFLDRVKTWQCQLELSLGEAV